MNAEEHNIIAYNNAKKKVRNLKVFYIHFIGYIVLATLLIWNLLIIEDTNIYKDIISAVNSITLVFWTLFIALHAIRAFTGKVLFNKNWERKKINEILDKEKDNNQSWL